MGRKRRLDNNQRMVMDEFLGKHVNIIKKAEIQTFKETEVSSHISRLYIFTTFNMGVAEIHMTSGDMPSVDVVEDVIGKFKSEEAVKLYDDPRFQQDGSQIIALLGFFPSTALRIDLNKIDELPDHLREKAINKTIELKDITGDPDFKERYKDLYMDVIAIHYVAYDANQIDIYKLVSHNDEVLDIFSVHNIDMTKKDVQTDGGKDWLRQFIEVE